MGYLAVSRLRFGDGWIEPGGSVPEEPGRDYQGMVRRGEIVLMPDDPKAEPDVSAEDLAAKRKRSELDKQAKEAGVENPEELANKDAVAEAIVSREQLDKLNRKQLDHRAELAGVEKPASLPNKGAVIDAILAGQEGQGSEDGE